MRKTVLTTGEVARHCQVSSETVANWIRNGKLTAYKTPGQHRRIRLDDFAQFLHSHDMPPYLVDESIADEPERRLLVVDDDPKVLELIVQYWQAKSGYEVVAARDGYEAGAQMIRFSPDVVLLDLLMPDMDGFKVCREIKTDPRTRSTLVIVMTGLQASGYLDRATDCGADYCIRKPFKLEQLASKVNELLDERSVEGQPLAFEARR